MDYKLKRVMSKIENGNIQSAHIYELVDTYYQCVIYKIDEYDDDEEPTDASYPEELLYQLPERQSGIFEAMSMLISEFIGVIAEYDVTDKLELYADGSVKKESLYGVADEYALQFIE